MDVHHVLQHNIVVVDFDPLSDASNGKELLVLVELDAGHYRTVVEHVRSVGEGGKRTDAGIKFRLKLAIASHLLYRVSEERQEPNSSNPCHLSLGLHSPPSSAPGGPKHNWSILAEE